MTYPIRVAVVAAALLPTVPPPASAESFATAAAKSAEKFKTPSGTEYGFAFMRSTGKVVISAAQACLKEQFPIGSVYDTVFIISASGQIERVVHGPRSAYGDCIASRLRGLRSAARPPNAPWPIHVRFLHGRVDPKAPEPPFMIIADDADPPR